MVQNLKVIIVSYVDDLLLSTKEMHYVEYLKVKLQM